MKVKILYLYPDFMNLYGDNGNVRIMERRLSDQGFEVEVICRTITDKDISFDVDFVFMGSGYESNRNLAAKHLIQFKSPLIRSIVNGVPMLFTGNSYDLLGTGIKTSDGSFVEGLGVFNFTFAEQSEKRYTGDAVLEEPVANDRYVGFINRAGAVENDDDLSFEIIKKIGNIPSGKDGARIYNFMGISLIGPVLLKNPGIAVSFVKTICERKGTEYKDISYPRSERSHEKTLKALMEAGN